MKETLSSYRIFLEVAKRKSMSKAANSLYISQPAISKSIAKLEESLDTTLFIRTKKELQLTEDGELLYQRISRAFQEIDLVETELQRRNELGICTLKIGVSTTLCKHLLLPYLKEFTSIHPQIKISISCQASHDTLKLLENDQIDIGIVGEPTSKNGLTFHSIEKIQDTFVATKGYLNNLKHLGIEPQDYLNRGNVMLLDKKNMTRQYVEQYLLKNQINLEDAIEVSDLDLLIEFSKIGIGIACVIRNFVQDELDQQTLTEVPIPLQIPPRNVGIAYKEQHLKNKALSAFIDFFLA